ncbi:MAG TPA: hypothetical protein VMV12_02200 [Candidatus Micrarchaeaceae archaeon]|nr:hypothetical protein [Candidatus Micrarchaeaceae archaeon]
MRVFDAAGRPVAEVEPHLVTPAWLLPEDIAERLQAVADGYRQHVRAAVVFSCIMAESGPLEGGRDAR